MRRRARAYVRPLNVLEEYCTVRFLLLALFLLLVPSLGARLLAAEVDDPRVPDILDLREQAAVRDTWLKQRLETVIPALMRREGIDLWLLIAREYNEDPVIRTMLPATWLSARRRTILLFHDPGVGKPIERLAVTRYPVGDVFPAAWDPEKQPDQWARVAQLVAERNPKKIALNRSSTFALADGLSASEADSVLTVLGKRYSSRVVSGERLALGWLETRIPEEIAVYPTIVRIAHAIIAEGLSERVITPGVTSTNDVQWWYRQRIDELGLQTWFHPTVTVQRTGQQQQSTATAFASPRPDPEILPGDLLHIDFGITYLGLNTDTQHHAYVLRPGETDAPAGLRAGLLAVNRVTDMLITNFRVGVTGNEVLARTREQATAAGLVPSIYSHPLGFHGHGAGAAIGMWDNQKGVAGTGDYVVQSDTAWSIELNVTHAVPEWGGMQVRFMAEEDAYFDGERVRWLDGRQERLHLIPRP
jgi:Xaa-Pro aminopeptidase